MNWNETPKCPLSTPLFVPKNATEVEYILSSYKIKKPIYTDFKRVSKNTFYRNIGKSFVYLSVMYCLSIVKLFYPSIMLHTLVNFCSIDISIFKSQTTNSYIDHIISHYSHNGADEDSLNRAKQLEGINVADGLLQRLETSLENPESGVQNGMMPIFEKKITRAD